MADLGDGASIIMGGQLPQLQSPMDAAVKAMTLKDLVSRNNINQIQSMKQSQEFNDNQTMRKAIADNTQIDKNTGAASVDQSGAIKQIAQTNPALAPQMQMDFNQKNLMAQKQQIEMKQQRQGMVGQALGASTDQASYTEQRQKLIDSGTIKESDAPPAFDPSFVKRMQMASLNAEDQLKQQNAQIDQQLKGQENVIKGKQADLDYYKTFGTKPVGQAPGMAPQMPAQTNPATDPSTLIKNAPPSQQEAIAKEISHNQNVASVAPSILDTHNKMVEALQNNKPAEYMALKKQYSAAVRSAYKDISDVGAREATVEGMVKDTAPGIEAKFTGDYGPSQGAVRSWIMSNQAAPNAKANGIDLTKFNSTSVDQKLMKIPGESPDQKTAGGSKGISHKDAPIGTVSNGMAKTAQGWVSVKDALSASK